MENSSDLPSVLWHVRLSQAPHQHTAGLLLGRSVMLQGQEDLQSREGQTAVWLAEGSPRNNSSSFQFIFIHLFFSTLQLHCLLFNLVIYLKNKKKYVYLKLLHNRDFGHKTFPFFRVAIPEMRELEHHHCAKPSVLWISWREQCSADEVAAPGRCVAGHSQAGSLAAAGQGVRAPQTPGNPSPGAR